MVIDYKLVCQTSLYRCNKSWPVFITLVWWLECWANSIIVITFLCLISQSSLKLVRWYIWKRGLFKTKDGRYLNSDINGSYQILKKVIGNYSVVPRSLKVLQVIWFYIRISGYALTQLVITTNKCLTNTQVGQRVRI